MKTGTEVLRSGSERVRAGAWRAEGGVGYLAPVPGTTGPSAAFLARCCDELHARGFSTVITGALAPSERQPFLAVGFQDREHLRLLLHDLRDLPPVPPIRHRRARRTDRSAVLALDRLTFSSFWRLDDLGLDQTVEATPAARFRVALDAHGGDRVIGYAITGKAGNEGYLQRLAVDPERRRAGVGRALALDGLHWLRRRSARRAGVNTQLDNEAAFKLYLALGFAAQPADLVVLQRRLDGS